MTFSKNFILKKLDEISGYLDEARDLFNKFNDEEILKSSGNTHIAERLLQLIVDTIIDINQHFVRELKFQLTDDFQSTFYVLGGNSILPEDFAKKIAPVVGLRNRIIHRYETIDKPLFIRTFRANISDFEQYVKFIFEYLEKKI